MAVLVVGSYLTATDTLPAGSVKVNVLVLIVAGFIALLNTAVTTALEQMPEEPTGGSTDNTLGGVKSGFVHTILVWVAAPGNYYGQAERQDPNLTNLKFAHRLSFTVLQGVPGFYPATGLIYTKSQYRGLCKIEHICSQTLKAVNSSLYAVLR